MMACRPASRSVTKTICSWPIDAMSCGDDRAPQRRHGRSDQNGRMALALRSTSSECSRTRPAPRAFIPGAAECARPVGRRAHTGELAVHNNGDTHRNRDQRTRLRARCNGPVRDREPDTVPRGDRQLAHPIAALRTSDSIPAFHCGASVETTLRGVVDERHRADSRAAEQEHGGIAVLTAQPRVARSRGCTPRPATRSSAKRRVSSRRAAVPHPHRLVGRAPSCTYSVSPSRGCSPRWRSAGAPGCASDALRPVAVDARRALANLPHVEA